ncbi:MAG: hypothetical protein AB1640_10920 [bacterium]
MAKRAILGFGILGSLIYGEIPLAILFGFIMVLGSLAEAVRASWRNRRIPDSAAGPGRRRLSLLARCFVRTDPSAAVSPPLK